MYIVGIDIAKRKHEAAVIDGDGAVIIKPFSFTNNCSGYNRLLAMLAKAKLPLDEVSFAMEATGHYWLALFTRLQKEGFRVQVINPVQTNSIRSFYIRQAKTDPRTVSPTSTWGTSFSCFSFSALMRSMDFSS